MDPLSDIIGRMRHDGGGEVPPAPPSVCPRCGGAGFLRYDVPVEHPNFGKLQRCECRMQEKAQGQLSRFRELSNLGPLESRRFEGFNPERGTSAYSRDALTTAKRIAQAYAKEPSGWLVLTGPSGAGKTHLAAAITNDLLDRGHGALWVFVPDFLDHLRAAYSPQSDTTYDALFNTVRDAPVVVLDDLGAHSASAWAEEKLYQILAHRYDSKLPTVITTNKLLDTFDGRMRSRLTDPHLSTVVGVIGYASEIVNRLMGLSYDLIRRMTFENFDGHPYSTEDARRNQYNLDQMLGLVQTFGQNPNQNKWLVLMGLHGVGKTHLAAATANYRLHRGLSTLFIVTPDLLDVLRASFGGDGSASYDKVFYEVRSAPFLILDDFGAQSSTPWAKEKLYQILNYRYNAQLPTMITTNQALENIDLPLQSRMSDREHCAVIAILAPDYRRNRGSYRRTMGR
jgi:DNA replication protein DnaC